MGHGFIVWLSSSKSPTEMSGWIFYVFTSPLPFKAREDVEKGEIWFDSYNSKERKQIVGLETQFAILSSLNNIVLLLSIILLLMTSHFIYIKFCLEKAVFVGGTHYKWLLWVSDTLNDESSQTVLYKESVINRKRGFIKKLLFIAGQQ